MEPEINLKLETWKFKLKKKIENQSKHHKNDGIWCVYHENVLDIHVKSDLKC